MRTCCLINPFSGGNRSLWFGASLNRLAKLDRNFVVQELSIEKYDEILKNAQQFDQVIFAGGDGSVSQALPYFLNTQTSLGIIPRGTGNDLARELGVFRRVSSRSLPDLLKVLRQGETREVAVWRFHFGEKSMLFCNYLSFGFDAGVVSGFDNWRRRRPNWFSRLGVFGNRLGYSYFGLTAIAAPQAIPAVKFSDPVTSCGPIASLLFANIRSYMGLGVSNLNGSPYDQQVEAILIPNVFTYLAMLSKLKLPLCLPTSLGSRGSWSFSLPPAHAQLDGEALGLLECDSYKIEYAGKVRMLVP